MADPKWEYDHLTAHGAVQDSPAMHQQSKRRKDSGKNKGPSANSSGSQSPSMPRLDPHERQLSRFYEPLVLLYTLGNTRGDHTSSKFSNHTHSTLLPMTDLRRGFLSELAYVCDYDKGGDTVTAIGLESTPEHYIFWVAANTCVAKKVVPFLQSLLLKLKHVAKTQAAFGGDMERIAEKCIGFGALRINKYKNLIRSLLRKCSEDLINRKSDDAMDLLSWLANFDNPKPDFIALCQFAYKERKSSFMQQLAALGVQPSYKTSEDAIQSAFALLRHYIGRLGHHFRAARTLVSSVARLAHLLDDFEVRSIPTPSRSTLTPLLDDKTRLDSIIVRMLPVDSPDLEFYQQALAKMDTTAQLSARMLENYDHPNFQPQVHAEIQVLEHFYDHKLMFAGSDKYIACSKPACYCCSLYIRHHPGKFVEPATHRNIYLNWRPPDLRPECGIDNRNIQRDILNLMTHDIRRDALHQISQRQAPHVWHPDSVTGITQSTYNEQIAGTPETNHEEMELTSSSGVYESEWEKAVTGYDATGFESSSLISGDFPPENSDSRQTGDFTHCGSEGDVQGEPVPIFSSFEIDSDSDGGVPLGTAVGL